MTHKEGRRALVVFFNDPELYPPTLNVLRELAARFEEVTFLGRSYGIRHFKYPRNVSIRLTESFRSRGLLSKVIEYREYFSLLLNELQGSSYDLILTQDSIALFVFYITSILRKQAVIHWHHVHDILERKSVKLLSIAHLSLIFESKAMSSVDYLTTPSLERLQYMSLQLFKGKDRFLPNYPSLSVSTEESPLNPQTNRPLKLIYQGRLGRNHGFESFIEILGEKVSGHPIMLTLIGPIDSSYRQELQSLADILGKTDWLMILEPVSYGDLMRITSQHHIGLAVHLPSNIIYTTGGTASNKIYEYVARGMPVLLHDNKHYRDVLGAFQWAYFTDLSRENLLSTLEEILRSYQEACDSALEDFREELNFEKAFNKFYYELDEEL